MEFFMIIAITSNRWINIVTKSFFLDVAWIIDPPLISPITYLFVYLKLFILVRLLILITWIMFRCIAFCSLTTDKEDL